MLDLKAIRINPEPFRLALKKRNAPTTPIDEIIQLDVDWRKLKKEADEFKAERNRLSMEINASKKAGHNIQPVIAKTKELSDHIKALDMELALSEQKMEAILLNVPNVPHESVPVAPDEHGNKEIRRVGKPKKDFLDIKPHYELLPKLLDFERGVKLSGSRFTVLWGAIARLERAISNYMLQTHLMHGYTEVAVPYMVSTKP